MLTDTDIFYFPGREPGRLQMGMAFGINGKIICDLATYKDFFNMLKSTDSIEPLTEDCSVVNFIKDGNIIETLRTSSFLGSLLCSKPDFLDIFTYPNQEQYEKNRGVTSGHLYTFDDNGEPIFTAPEWVNDGPDENGLHPIDKEFRLMRFYTGD